MYSGKLTIYNRKTNPILLKLKSENYDSFIVEFMDDNLEFKGSSVSDVSGKLSKWYYHNGMYITIKKNIP